MSTTKKFYYVGGGEFKLIEMNKVDELIVLHLTRFLQKLAITEPFDRDKFEAVWHTLSVDNAHRFMGGRDEEARPTSSRTEDDA